MTMAQDTVFAFEQTLENKTKKDILAEKIIEMIVTGLLRDNDVLPSERELSQLFGVSRETVRGALRLVAAYGLISVSHGSKTRITAGEAQLARFHDSYAHMSPVGVNQYDIDTVFESRSLIEAAIARKAAVRIDQEGLDKLRRMLEAQAGMFHNPVHFQLSDKNFHKLIAEYAGNELLLKYSEELYSYGLNIRRSVMLEPGAIARSYGEHCQIVEALARGDGAAAEQAMLGHLTSVYSTTREKMPG